MIEMKRNKNVLVNVINIPDKSLSISITKLLPIHEKSMKKGKEKFQPPK